MARTPIRTRTGYFELVNRNSTITRISDYQVVEFTEAGIPPAVEPRPILAIDAFKVLDQDLVDIGCDTFIFKDPQAFQNDWQGVHSMQQTPRDWSL